MLPILRAVFHFCEKERKTEVPAVGYQFRDFCVGGFSFFLLPLGQKRKGIGRRWEKKFPHYKQNGENLGICFFSSSSSSLFFSPFRPLLLFSFRPSIVTSFEWLWDERRRKKKRRMRSEEGFVIAGTSMEKEKEEEEGGEAIGKFLITPRLGEEPSVERRRRGSRLLRPPSHTCLPARLS